MPSTSLVETPGVERSSAPLMSNWRVSAISRAVVMITLDGAVLSAGAGGGGAGAGVAATPAGAGAGLGAAGAAGADRERSGAPTSMSGSASCAKAAGASPEQSAVSARRRLRIICLVPWRGRGSRRRPA